MNRYVVRITQHNDIIIEADTGDDAKRLAIEALLDCIPPKHKAGKHIIDRKTKLSKNPRVEKVR